MTQPINNIKLDIHHDFAFKIEGDNKLYKLPLMQYLPIKIVRDLGHISAKEDGDEKNIEMLDFMIDILDRYTPGLTDDLTQSDMGTIFEAWSDASETNMGE